MPDQQKKRQQIIEATAKIIAAEGMEATTTRRIAQQSGCSLGILSHYFVGKDEIVIGALNWCDQRFTERLSELYQSDSLDLEDFSSLFLALLPLDSLSDTEWRVRSNWISYSLTHPQLKPIRREKLDFAVAMAEKFVKKLQREGGLRKDIDAALLASTVIDLSFGISINLLSIPLSERASRVDDLLGLLPVMLRPENISGTR